MVIEKPTVTYKKTMLIEKVLVVLTCEYLIGERATKELLDKMQVKQHKRSDV